MRRPFLITRAIKNCFSYSQKKDVYRLIEMERVFSFDTVLEMNRKKLLIPIRLKQINLNTVYL
jgi:hypothetical protein